MDKPADFFDIMSNAITHSGDSSSISPEVWDKFNSSIDRPIASTPPGDDSWPELRAEVVDCKKCGLREGCIQTVFADGNENADLMFIGEGPGGDEDREGRPFVGVAGQLLDKMIQAMQFHRQDVYIANIVKCRPPGNRAPNEDEAAACIGYLKRQIKLVSPQVIVLLGAVPLRFLMGIEGIKRNRGHWLEYEGIPVMPTFHPAYLLRSPEDKRLAWNDLKLVMQRFGIEPSTNKQHRQ